MTNHLKTCLMITSFISTLLIIVIGAIISPEFMGYIIAIACMCVIIFGIFTILDQ